MADNTNLNSMTGGDIISTDVITTLNGAGIATGEKAQRVKVGWGADATFNDTTAANPLPVTNSSLPLPTGAATAALQTTIDGHLTDGTQQARLTDGTNIVNVLKSDGTTAGQNAAIIAGTRLEVPFTTTTVQAVGTTDVSNYNWVSVHVTSNGTSSIGTFQVSNDNTNWLSLALQLSSSTTGTNGSATFNVTNVGYHGPIPFRYFRINVTGISAGTTAGTIEFKALPLGFTATNVGASQVGTWTAGISALATGGFTPGHIVSAATTNAAVIKASAGTLSSSSAFNISGSPRYVHFYNKATTPTVGTDVPVQTYGIPGNTSGSGYTLPLPPQGLVFAAGISYSITSGMSDTDAGAIGAGDVVLNWGSA